MGALVRAHDWAATPLGPVEGWPQSLRTAVDICLGSALPSYVWWGRELVQVYNDAALAIVRAKHPAAFGAPAREAWAEIWEAIGPLVERVAGDGQPVLGEDLPMAPDRGGPREPAYFTFSFGALRDGAGALAGLFATAVETTERVRAEAALRASEARRAFLLGLSDALLPLADPVEIQRVAMRLLGEHLGLSRAFYFRAEREDGGWVHVVESDYHQGSDQQSVVGRHPLEHFGSSLFAGTERGEIVRVPDVNAVSALTPEELRNYLAFDVAAFVNVPLVKAGDYVAGICVHDSSPRAWTSADVELIGEVAVRTWAAVERARAEAALRESEALFRTLADVAPYLVWSGEAPNADLYNRRWYDYTGLDEAASLRPDAWHGVVHPDDLPLAVERSARSARTGEPYEIEYRLRRADGDYRWHIARAFRVPGGRRWVGAAADIDDLKRAQEGLRESEARFRTMAETIGDVFYVTDLKRGALAYLSPAYERVWGRPAADLHADLASFLDTIHPDDRPIFAGGKATQERGEPVVIEYRIVRPDGAIRWILDRSFPVAGGGGRRSAGVAQDVTARREVEREVRASRRRWRALVEGIPQLVWRAVDGGEWTWSSPQWTAFTGLSEEVSKGHGWLAALHRDDREAAMGAWHVGEARGAIEVEYRLRHAATGRHRWFQTRATAVRDEEGRVVEWLGTSTDIDDLRRLREEQGVLVAELQHRTRNLIGVVNSIANQTIEASGSLEGFGARFNARLGALSRVQGLLSRASRERVTIGALVRMELDAMGAEGVRDRDRVALDGPEVSLRRSTVQTLALGLHELATNARKYGALATEHGRLRVTWRVRDVDGAGQWLTLEWVEEGVDRRREERGPTRRGYGRELLERALPYSLGAETRFELDDDGVRCMIDLPLA